jgi:8-amino-7-oxononanoate synthase
VPVTWPEWVAGEIASLRSAQQWRAIRTLAGRGPRFRLPDGRQVVSFASNDYLGLSRHPEVVSAAARAASEWGTGAASSRLIVGARPYHDELEASVADWLGEPAAVVLPTGYMANLAVLTTFGAGARVVSDELNHASIIDGARLARTEVTVYRHGDVEHAAALVRSAPGRVLVVTDSVFSMDGDLAPVAALSEMCARHGALLVLDDAHAVLGRPTPAPGTTCVRVGTLSKTLGALGGYVTGPADFVALLVNRARSFIFTTAPSPMDMAAATAAIGVCRSPEGMRLRARLADHVELLRPGHPTPIIPVVIGAEADALAAADRLLEVGILVPAIRPPTVPPGTSRLRVALSADHRVEEVRALAAALGELADVLPVTA